MKEYKTFFNILIYIFIFYFHITHIIYYIYISRTVSVVTYWHYNNGHTVCIQIQSNLYNKKGHSMQPEIVTYYEQLPFREQPFSLKGGYVFFLKKYSDSQCC
jgi:hypothetical protein